MPSASATEAFIDQRSFSEVGGESGQRGICLKYWPVANTGDPELGWPVIIADDLRAYL
jgi:hypothetical protein